MKTIIALQGKAHIGKSETIHILCSLMINSGYLPAAGNYAYNKSEFWTVLIKDGKRVGITSFGDSYTRVRKSLGSLLKDDCQVLLCACRSRETRGQGTISAIEDIQDTDKVFYQKSIDENTETRNETNRNEAKQLFDKIESLL